MLRWKRYEETEVFIEAYQAEHPLWNIHSRSYKDRNAKKESLKRFGDKMEMNENEVRSKIANLRTYFSKELAKERDSAKSGAGIDQAYEPKWPHYKSMEFLRDIIIPRKSKFILDQSDDFDDVANVIVVSEQFDSESEEAHEERPSTKQPLPKKNKRNPSPDRMTHVLMEKAINVLDTLGKREAEDQDELFGRFITQQLRKFDPRDRDFLRFKIQELIFNYEFNQLPLPPAPTKHGTTGLNSLSPPQPAIRSPVYENDS